MILKKNNLRTGYIPFLFFFLSLHSSIFTPLWWTTSSSRSLRTGVPQGSAFRPLFLTLFMSPFFQSQGFKLICTPRTSKILSPAQTSLKLQIHVYNYLFNISTWLSNRRLKFTVFRNEVLTFTLKPTLLPNFSTIVNSSSIHSVC